METPEKTWPLLGKILIGLGGIGGLRGVIVGLSQNSVIELLLGILQLAIFWNIFKFRRWSVKALTVLLSLNILSSLYLMLFGILDIFSALFVVTLNGLIIYYFNSPKIKPLFL